MDKASLYKLIDEIDKIIDDLDSIEEHKVALRKELEKQTKSIDTALDTNVLLLESYGNTLITVKYHLTMQRIREPKVKTA